VTYTSTVAHFQNILASMGMFHSRPLCI